MKLNERLNLVIPMEDGDGNKYWLHSTPFSREAFETHYLMLSQAFSLMIEQGIQVTAGPRVAALVLKDLAEKQNKQDEYTSIMAEVRRVTSVIKGSEHGYQPVPLSTAISRGIVSKEDAEDAESLIVFFILVSALWKGDRLRASFAFMNGLWGSENTSLNSTAFAASLPTLTEDVSSGETAAVS